MPSLEELSPLFPAQAVRMALVLLLSFFIGLEREEHKQKDGEYGFGGVRTFPLIGLLGYALALVSPDPAIPISLGLVVVGAFMALSYRHKLATSDKAGITTEISALTTYLVGVLAARDALWLAAAIGVVSVLLLELKRGLEGLAQRFSSKEIVTFTQFLLLAVVVLPVVPHHELTAFHLNPFKIWLVVVAVSGVSYGSYVLRRVAGGRGGVLLSGLLGGAYSSTFTTVALARQAKGESQPNLYAGGILAASGVMYARLALLIAIFNWPLAKRLLPWFLPLAVVGVGAGWLLSRVRGTQKKVRSEGRLDQNPLELKSAFLFAAVLVVVLVVTGWARQALGQRGLYGLSAVMGIFDVDPFILGVAQSPAEGNLVADAGAIAIAAASNNVAKAGYAFFFADRATGLRALAALGGLALLGLSPLLA